MTQRALEPCPFCGGVQPAIGAIYGFGHAQGEKFPVCRVECTCGAHGPTVTREAARADDAIACWNLRSARQLPPYRSSESEANAAFIVAACNSHATLKARIEELESETARLSALWIGETRRVEELEAALKKTLGVIEQEELHGFGAHDSSCSLCRSVKDARATLASGGAAVTSTDGGVA